jgi:hypothetical protein
MTIEIKNQRLFLVLPSFGDARAAVEIASEVEKLYTGELIVCILDDSVGEDKFPRLPSNYYLVQPTRNLGQQRLLVNFLRYSLPKLFENQPNDLVLIMDSDGEDSPGDVPELIKELKSGEYDFACATRKSRQTDFTFKIGYFGFQLLTRILTGIYVRYGTFSVSRREILQKTVKNDAFSQSFVGGLMATPNKKVMVNCNRGKRRYGESNMNKNNLIVHGLRILLALSPTISGRLLFTTVVSTIFSIFIIFGVVIAKMLNLVTPGWTTVVVVGLIEILILEVTILMLTLGLIKHANETSTDGDFKVMTTH